MFTSYFGNIANVRNPLSISGVPPFWYNGFQYKLLAPKWSFYDAYASGKLTAEGYTEAYLEQVLKRFDPRELYDKLIHDYGEDVTLLCYEQPGEFCHRRIVANWFELYLGVSVPELP